MALQESALKGDSCSDDDILVVKKKVDKNPITIHAEGREFEDLVLVDLPGIISNGSGKEEVINMINQYIKPKESLILIVTEAKQDEETAQALELAKNFDLDEERSIRVLTKYDMFDTEKSKARANLMVSTINDLSPHGVICRPDGETYSAELEQTNFNQYNLPKERTGVESLKNRLPKLLCNLINTNMPGLKKQVLMVLKENQKNLLEVGQVVPDNTRILLEVQETLYDDLNNLQEKLTLPMVKFREHVHNSKDFVTSELVEELYSHDAFKCIFFQGEKTFNEILEKVVEIWYDNIEELYLDVEKILQELFNTKKINKISTRLRNCIDNSWEESRQKILEELKTSMIVELQKEKKFKTMNHYLTSKYKENLVLPEELLDKIIESIQSETVCVPCKGYEVLTLLQIRDNMRDIIESALENHSDAFNREPIEEQHKRRIFAAAQANWAVSHKNLTDNIISTIQKFVLEGTTEWINKTLIEDEKIKNNTSEDPKIKNKRIQYKQNIEVMQKCLTILQSQ